MKGTLPRIALFAVLVHFSTLVSAQGFYVGAGVGRSDLDDSCDELRDDPSIAVIDCDDTDTGWKLFGGYQFTQHFGVEAAYVDLGEASARAITLGVPVRAKAEVDGFGIFATGALPVGGSFSIVGKLGGFYSDVDVKASAPRVRVSDDESSLGLAAGAAAQYDVNERVVLRIEWERYFDVGDDDIGEADIDLIAFGILINI